MAAAYAIKARYYVARREPAALVLTVQQSSRNGGVIADDLPGFAGRPASVEGLSLRRPKVRIGRDRSKTRAFDRPGMRVKNLEFLSGGICV